MSLFLVTDSAADLPKPLLEEYGIGMAPVPVKVDGKQYLDGVTLMPGQFYEMLKNGLKVQTDEISEDSFYEFFKPYAERGDEVIYCATSSELSEIFANAQKAKARLLYEYHDFQLKALDSREASLGLGLPVLSAAECLADGASKEYVISKLKFDCQHQKLIFTLPDLSQLIKSGRLSGEHIPSNGVCPIYEIDPQGRFSMVDKAKDFEKAAARLLELAGQYGTSLSGKRVGIVHGNDEALLCYAKRSLSERYDVKEFVESCAGCAVGAFSGAGMLGIIFEY